MRRLMFASLACALTIISAISAMAHEFSVGAITIGHPWSRATPAGAKVGGAYVVITNNGAEADTLVSASTDVANRVEFHQMTTKDDVMRMAQVTEPLVIAPGQTVSFEPGGLHIMLFELLAGLKEGASFSGTLVFEKAGPVKVEFKVEKLGAQSPASNPAANENGADEHHKNMGLLKK